MIQYMYIWWMVDNVDVDVDAVVVDAVVVDDDDDASISLWILELHTLPWTKVSFWNFLHSVKIQNPEMSHWDD